MELSREVSGPTDLVCVCVCEGERARAEENERALRAPRIHAAIYSPEIETVCNFCFLVK